MSEGEEGGDSPLDSDGGTRESPSGESKTHSSEGTQFVEGNRPPESEPEMDFGDRIDRAQAAIRRREDGPNSQQLVEYTTDRRDLAPTVRILWGIWTVAGATILALILTGIISALDWSLVLGLPVWAVLLALGMFWVELRYRVWIYQVQADSLYLERGVITHRRTHVPYVRIQHVDTSRSPLERWLGLSTLVVYTAGSRGADVSIPGLKPAEASDLQGRVKDLAIEAEGGDAL